MSAQAGTRTGRGEEGAGAGRRRRAARGGRRGRRRRQVLRPGARGLDPKELRGLLDEAKQRIGSGVAAIVCGQRRQGEHRRGVTDDLTGRFSAVDLVRAGVEALGGKGGGGRPDMAQGGGPDGDKAPLSG
jgi:alanyl-tRNA synthetase